MAGKKQVVEVAGNRQSAYTSRNRAALIKSAQVVLAEVGLHATMEQLATSAQVSPTTIYKYFASREALLSEALDEAWRDWVQWAHAGETVGVSFQKMIDVCRKLFRAKQTHPQFANILKNAFVDPGFALGAVQSAGISDLREISKIDGWVIDQFEERVYLMSYSLAGIMSGIYVTEMMTPEKADASLELSLQILDISKAKARKLVSHPLVYPEPTG